VTRLRLTVRARLTLLYTGLFAICGAIVVAVSYTLLAVLAAPHSRNIPASIQAQCQREFPNATKKSPAMVRCLLNLVQQQVVGPEHDLTLSHLLQYLLTTLVVVIAVAAVLGWIFSGRALRPVRLITMAARAASEQDLSARVAPTGPRDELRELAETFDDMLSRLQAAFESQQRFIANASHELRTPLAVMGATVDVVLGNPDSSPGELRGMAADIRAEVDHAEHLIGALLMLARNERGLTVCEEVDLATAAEDVLDTAHLGDLRVHATLEPAFISGDPLLAERLIANLVDNAVRYNITAGDIWISTRTTAGNSQVCVANTGPVISPADAVRIFQPFQRLSDRTSHDGFGLGLAIVGSIAAIHSGTVTAHPRDDGGLLVAVTIPSADAPAQGNEGQATKRPGVRR
jgi:signal transduction histidine kinase